MLDTLTAEALRHAMAALQSGDFVRARRMADTALSKGGDLVALNAFIGMVRAREGDVAGAIDHLRIANQARPGDFTIACNLIAALIELGDFGAALSIATAGAAMADPSLRIARYRGYLAQQLDFFAEAAEAYEHVLAKAPDDFESWNNLGNARQAIQDIDGSIAALERAIAIDPKAAPTRLNLAAAFTSANRLAEAEAVLRQAIIDFPDDARPLHELYVNFKREGRQQEALPFIEQAVALDPNSPGLLLKLGVEYGIVMRTVEAEAIYRRAIVADPGLVDAYLGLAIQFEHTNREEEFPSLIALAERNGLESGALDFLRALEHRRAGRFAEGLACLANVPDTIEPERAAHIRATLLDRLGRTEEAFAAFEETARLHQASPTDPLGRGAELRDELRREIEMLTPSWAASWGQSSVASDMPDPVFLVGFPRSGTTLLDTILMGHSGTTVLEEKLPLNHVDQALGGLSSIPSLSDADIARARGQYFDEVRAIEAWAPPSLLIDKSPLFLHKAPLIQRLFPNARFILALRHPCDVLLSCFMSNFRLNAAMSNFLRLEDAAQLYDLTFRHWERSCTLLPLNVHRIYYEKLIADVEGEVRPLLDFLGLEWQDHMLDHQQTAKSRGLITTASYSQVTEPIYTRASGRWMRYREKLEPILPFVAPWAERFGYEI